MTRVEFPIALLGAFVLIVGSAAASGQTDELALEDILAGFDDEAEESTEADPNEEPNANEGERFDLTGSLSLGTSYNVTDHRSSIGPDPPPAPGTDYSGTQRLRTRADIQADVSLPRDWKGRIQAFAFYDFAYLIHGKELYTQNVIEDYEFEAEILDFWIQGSLTSWLDLKLGRQVVNWGRSDTLRVTDIWNALNNREPGMVDIEELRLPSTMARADAYFGQWQLTVLVVPEIRYDYNPPPGSDFFPALDFGDLPNPPPGAPPKSILGQSLLAHSGQANEAKRWGAIPEFGAALTGTFSGWDFSLYAARVYQNQTSTVVGLPDLSLASAYRIDTGHDRITMLGTGLNYTRSSWLLKAEVAFLDELDYTFLVPNPAFSPPTQEAPYALSSRRLSRFDWMVGLEYYGFGDTTVSLDFAHRHVIDYDPWLQFFPNYVYENSFEAALRVGSEFFNGRLRANALGVGLANEKGFQGGILRLWGDYELVEAFFFTGGYIHYFGTDQVPFDTWQRNGRIFFNLKFSFP